MEAMQHRAMNIANDTRRQHRHQALMAALKCIETGDYGYCLNCDDAIGVGRLGIDLAVTLCVQCA
jgi:DnaK suppressor protein